MGLLRFLFALSVITSHTGPILGSTFIGGKMAVQGFFMLSGFYIALILKQKYAGRKKFYRLFITNRILRIYPTYFIVLLFSAILSIIFFTHGIESKLSIYYQYKQALNPVTLGYLIFSNLFILGIDVAMFMGIDVSHGIFFFTNDYLNTHPQLYYFFFIPQAWTLSLEMLFYFLAPFLVKRKISFLLVLIVFSIFLRFYLYRLGLHREPWTNRFFPTELAFFLFGVLSFKLYEFIKKRNTRVFSIMIIIIVMLFTVFYNFIQPNPNPGDHIDGIQLTYFVMLLAGMPFVFQLTKNSGLDKLFGMFSYPIYISHMFVIDFLGHLGLIQSKLFAVETVLLTILISTVLIIFIEKPIDRFRQARLSKKRK